MGLEVYNKPTIKYRIEGFSFFICNAWELMLKAKLLNDGVDIYYKDSPSRTLSLEKVVSLVYTDKKQPLRVNLEKIIGLRNTSTHFITEDYESVYAPFFQACVRNFSEQIRRFHSVDITSHISQNFLTLSVNMNTLTNDEIRAKLSPEMAEKLINSKNDLDFLAGNTGSNALYIPVYTQFLITKNPNNADIKVAIDNKSPNKIRAVKELKNPNDTHRLSFNNVIQAINARLKSENIDFVVHNGKEFNQYTLQLFMNYYNLKDDEKFAFKVELGSNSNHQYKYSQQIVEFIVEQIKIDPQRVIDKLKRAKEKR
jgi:hypothetical protein